MDHVIRCALIRVASPQRSLELPEGLLRLRLTCLRFRPTSPSSFLCDARTLFRCELVCPGPSAFPPQRHRVRIFVLLF